MKTIIAALIALAPALAGAEQSYNPDFVEELRSLEMHEEAFQYALTWAGNGDPTAEFEIASSLLDGLGTPADPMAAMRFACGPRQMDSFYVDKIIVQGNLRLAGTGTELYRCSAEE